MCTHAHELRAGKAYTRVLPAEFASPERVDRVSHWHARRGLPSMIEIFRRTTLSTTLAGIAAAGALACNDVPAPASPPTGAPSVATAAPSSKPLPPGPRIVGTILVTATGKPSIVGGVVYLEDAPKQPGEAMTATINVDHKEFSPSIAVITTGGPVTLG